MLNALEDNKNNKSEDVAQYNKTIEKLKLKLKAVTDESIRHREKLIAIQLELQTKIEIMKVWNQSWKCKLWKMSI